MPNQSLLLTLAENRPLLSLVGLSGREDLIDKN